MTKLRFIISFLLVLFLAAGQDSFCQDEYNFLPDKEGFNEELKKFFDKYGSSNGKDILKNFLKYSDKTELEENEWIAIAEICNNLTARKNNRYLYISGFIEALSTFQFNPDRQRSF